MDFVHQGTLHRFDSVRELIALCRARYPGAEVHTINEDGNFILRVRQGDRQFDSLIVHFEGERCYAAKLPAT